MSGYQEWLYARSCEPCQRGRDAGACLRWVFVDGEKVRCTCHGAEANKANDGREITSGVFGQDEAADAGDGNLVPLVTHPDPLHVFADCTDRRCTDHGGAE